MPTKKLLHPTMSSRNYSGWLIALEGIDGSGKTTQAIRVGKQLVEYGHSVVLSKELTSNIGKCIREEFERGALSPIEKSLLFAADRFYRLDREIIPELRNGKVVIADRWVLTSIVYRLAEGEGADIAEYINRTVISPDLTILLDITAEMSHSRDRSEGNRPPYSLSFLNRCRELYLGKIGEFGLVRIDASLPMEEVTMQIISRIFNFLETSHEN